MNQLQKKNKRNVLNLETTLGKSLTMVLRQVHMLRLESQENLEIARH